MPPSPDLLTVEDHNRNLTGMTYVYPALSRRAGGVSLGINLNPNNACNWRCIYCQVPELVRGGPPPIDLARLEAELAQMLAALYEGDFLERYAPPGARRVVDVAFSGNGEPTSAREFATAVDLVCRVIADRLPTASPLLRLITNGSLLDRMAVQRGIAGIGRFGGEVWFKIDSVGAASTRRINSVACRPETVLRRLRSCARLSPTWVQTCLFALDGQIPIDFDRYLELLAAAADVLAGIHLYGLARPSHQPEAVRLNALSRAQMEDFAAAIRRRTGLEVRISP